MSNYPQSIDTDVSLPPVNDNLDDIGEVAVNSLRDAVINIEQFVGTGVSGQLSLAQRLGLLIQPDGYFNFSYLTSLGLVTLPIYDNQIADGANIQESKLNLNYGTIDLYNDILVLGQGVETVTNWISVSGVKLEPHLIGAIYRHDLTQIDVIENSVYYLNSVFRTAVGVNINRSDHNGNDNVNAFLMLNNINNELTFHQWADGSPPAYTLADGYVLNTIQNIITNNGGSFPSNFAHTASGIYLNSTTFQNTPQTIMDVQTFADYVDTNIFEVENTILNLVGNGVSRNSNSSILTADGYGPAVVPLTPVTAYLSISGSPMDSYSTGDDIIQFNPAPPSNTDGYAFDAAFALVRVGDIIRVNYGTVEVGFVIREKKYTLGVYSVRIAGKNLFSGTAMARIDRPVFNNNKYGVLAVAPSNGIAGGPPPNLVVGNPQGAQVLGVGFNPDLFDAGHYNLYLVLYPYGSVSDGYSIAMPAIDVTGNQGATPGAYTLESIVAATNNQFRQPGYNCRFIAFSYQGEFGIMLADSYNNASFSIVNFIIGSSGINASATTTSYPNNIIDVSNTVSDGLGFGAFGANIASPPYTASYSSNSIAYTYPTRLFVPLKRNNFYVDGAENSTLSLPNTIDGYQVIDKFGDGYWIATITNVDTSIGGKIGITYSIPEDLISVSNLAIGKTIVVQSLSFDGSYFDFGRFTISAINAVCSDTPSTLITVWDGMHARPYPSIFTPTIGLTVAIYFNSDSIVFNAENASDFSAPTYPLKRYFEVYIDENNDTYPLERGRLFNPATVVDGYTATLISGIFPVYSNASYTSINIVGISSTLRGYQQFSTGINKITFQLQSYSPVTGIYTGLLCNTTDGYTFTNLGPLTTGQVGQVTRFYDNTFVDYLDLTFDDSSLIATPLLLPTSTPVQIDIQLFPTLALDKSVMLLASCQVNGIGTGAVIDHFTDRRQFGNISEQELSTSALALIAESTKLISDNGIIRGFDVVSAEVVGNNGVVVVNGGVAIVNGKVIEINSTTLNMPIVVEALSGVTNNTNPVINWFLCVNDSSELELVASTDLDPNVRFNPYGSLTNLRVFYAYNPSSSGPAYVVRSDYLSDIVLNQRDITPIAMITTTVNYPGIAPYTITAISSTDFRRYITNGFGGLSTLTLGPNASFRSFESAINWASQTTNLISATNGSNNIVFNKFDVVGVIDVTSPVNLQFLSNVTFDGNDGNGVININAGGVINLNATAVDLSGYTTLTGLTFNVNVANGILLNGCYFNINNNTFNWTYDPSIGPDAGYSSSNLINSQNGLIYGAAIQNTNIDINDNVFNWTSSNVSATTVNRYPFISFEFPYLFSGLQNININDNSFFSTTINNYVNDIRPAVAFISTIGHSSDNLLGRGTYLANVSINNNICYQDQMIAITSLPDNSGNIQNGLTTLNVRITNNVCGLISFFNRFAAIQSPFYNNSYQVLDKNYGLLISGNTCKIIGSTDGTGLDMSSADSIIYPISGSFAIIDNTCSWILPVTNFPIISGNTNISNATMSSVIIRGNNLNGDSNVIETYLFENAIAAIYVTNYSYENWDITAVSGNEITTAGDNGFIVGQNVYISGLPLTNTIFQIQSIVSPTAFKINTATSLPSGTPFPPTVYATCQFIDIVIEGNNINQGQMKEGALLAPFDNYPIGIHSEQNARIANNTISGFTTYGIQLQNPASTVTGNKLYRGSTSISAFVDVGSSVFPFGQHLIVNNYFDNMTTNGSSENLIINLPGTSSALQNVNQTVYIPVSLTPYFADPYSQLYNSANFSSSFTFYAGGEIWPDIGTFIIFPSQSTAGASPLQWNLYFNVADVLPPNITILNIALGVGLQTSEFPAGELVATTGANITQGLYNSFSNAYNPYSMSGSIVDINGSGLAGYNLFSNQIADVVVPFDSTTPGSSNVSNINAGHTIFIMLDLNGFPVSNNNTTSTLSYGLSLEWYQNSSVHSTDDLFVNFSPVVFKCRW